MKKVRDIGIGGMLGDWIENWLTNRKQKVVINVSSSDWAEVKSGVPQGSILGPLLFTVYINDLEENLYNSLLKFADDTKLWGRVNTKDEVLRMHADLETLSKWSDKNEMPVNISKCKVMHIGKKNSKEVYMLKGQGIEEVKEERDLGVFSQKVSNPL